MESILYGTLITKQDLNVFDELLTFLLKDGSLLKCVALGTRKITSKNARSLVVGNSGEIEAFMARNEGRLSKLKKFTATLTMPPAIVSSYAMNFVMEMVGTGMLEFNANPLVGDTARLVRLVGDDKTLIYAILAVAKGTGIPFSNNRCVECGKTEGLRLSYRAGGAKCFQHYDVKNDGTMDQESADLLQAVIAFGYRPLVTWRGEIGPLLLGLITFFQINSGYQSKTLLSVRRWYGRVIKDQ